MVAIEPAICIVIFHIVSSRLSRDRIDHHPDLVRSMICANCLNCQPMGEQQMVRGVQRLTPILQTRCKNALLMADVAHIAGLIVAGLHPSPVPHCHFVTSTTHKTLRGPRGGIVLCTSEWAEAIDKAVFPGVQGGPLMHVIAAKAVAFAEAMEPEWRDYQQRVVENSAALCAVIKERGWRIVSGGTDNHLFLVDLGADFISGKKAERWLGLADITVNKNTVPFDTRKPYIASGLRIGTPAITTRGMGPVEMEKIAELIDRVLRADEDKEDEAKMAAFTAEMEAVKAEVHALTAKFPLY